ncbi:MAG: imelysin family protein [Pseudomonadota bacterium]
MNRNAHALTVLMSLLLLAGCGEPDAPPDTRQLFLDYVFENVGKDYHALSVAATAQQRAVDALCARPTDAMLASAQQAFRETVLAWSRVEWLRLGPVATDYRFERLFYWPDKRGRGQRQLQQLIASHDGTALTQAALAQKSVAVQGLPALERLLFAPSLDTSEQLTENGCALAVPIAENILSISRSLADDWMAFGSSQAALSRSGEPMQRDQALAAVLQSAAQVLRYHGELKLALAMGESPATARPTVAPFAQSEMTVPAIAAGVVALREVFAAPFMAIVPAEHRYAGEAFQRDLKLIQQQLDALSAAGTWTTVVAGTEERDRLEYILVPLGSAAEQIGAVLPAALGLSLSFNSADGD